MELPSISLSNLNLSIENLLLIQVLRRCLFLVIQCLKRPTLINLYLGTQQKDDCRYSFFTKFTVCQTNACDVQDYLLFPCNHKTGCVINKSSKKVAQSSNAFAYNVHSTIAVQSSHHVFILAFISIQLKACIFESFCC